MSCLSIAVFAVVAVFVAAEKPCLPNEWQADGSHSLGFNSVVALSYERSIFGMRRPGTSKMVKQYSKGSRFDITPGTCSRSDIPKEIDIPQCVPDDAVEGEGFWSFTNANGATLQYAAGSPGRLLKKISPDGKQSVTFTNFAPKVTDPNIFKLPTRCDNL